MAQIHPRLSPIPVPTPRSVLARTRLPLGRLAQLARAEQVARRLQPINSSIPSATSARLRLVTPRFSPRRLSQPSHGTHRARGPILLRHEPVAQILI